MAESRNRRKTFTLLEGLAPPSTRLPGPRTHPAAEREIDLPAPRDRELDEAELVAHVRAEASSQVRSDAARREPDRRPGGSAKVVEVRLVLVAMDHEPIGRQVVEQADESVAVLHVAAVLGVEVRRWLWMVMAQQDVHRERGL